MPTQYYSAIIGSRNHFAEFLNTGTGKNKIYRLFENSGVGHCAVITVYVEYVGSGTGKCAILRAFENAGIGRNRIAESDSNTYVLYLSDDLSTLFDSSYAEFTAASYLTAALAADKTYYMALRTRNKFGIETANITPTIIAIDAGGDEVSVPPSNADNITLSAAAGGLVNIKAEYSSRQDQDPADTWLIYLTTNGDDPDPDTDTPIEETMFFEGGVAFLKYTTGEMTDGLTVKAIIRTRNSGATDYDSDDDTIYSVTTDTDGPSAVDPSVINADDSYAHAQNSAMVSQSGVFEFEIPTEDGNEYLS